jgi:hypothetical protein
MWRSAERSACVFVAGRCCARRARCASSAPSAPGARCTSNPCGTPPPAPPGARPATNYPAPTHDLRVVAALAVDASQTRGALRAARARFAARGAVLAAGLHAAGAQHGCADRPERKTPAHG